MKQNNNSQKPTIYNWLMNLRTWKHQPFIFNVQSMTTSMRITDAFG